MGDLWTLARFRSPLVHFLASMRTIVLRLFWVIYPRTLPLQTRRFQTPTRPCLALPSKPPLLTVCQITSLYACGTCIAHCAKPVTSSIMAAFNIHFFSKVLGSLWRNVSFSGGSHLNSSRTKRLRKNTGTTFGTPTVMSVETPFGVDGVIPHFPARRYLRNILPGAGRAMDVRIAISA